MEPECTDEKSTSTDGVLKKTEDFCIIKSNWDIDNDKNFNDCISTVSLSQAPDRTNLEDVVSLDTCIALKSDPAGESCRIEFEMTNKQKIARIAVVSEASVLEFFKQSGEYASTIFADFVDEFQDHAVYFAEAKIQPPSTEASIKFTRSKHKGTAMWIYGIKLILTESTTTTSKNMFDLEVINSFLSNSNNQNPTKAEFARKVLDNLAGGDIGNDMNMCLQKLTGMNWDSHKFQENKSDAVTERNSTQENSKCSGDFVSQDPFNIKTYIDEKFTSLEKRLMDRIELMEQKTNEKLDAILKHLTMTVDNE